MNSSTKSTYYINNAYTSERLKLHDTIIKSLFKKSNSLPFEALLLGGGSASGKSFVGELLLEAFKEENLDVTYIDADEIKKYIPEYNELLETNDEYYIKKAAAFVHDESSDIAEKLLNKCIDEKSNFIYDGTMKNLDKYQNLISTLRFFNYKIKGVIVDVPLETALERAQIRFQAEGRYVPHDVIIDSHKSVALTFSKLQDEFDEFVLYDNTKQPAEPFATKIQSVITIIDDHLYNSFLNKASDLVKK
ncbi:zeta toxin family protein [Lysinibacillus capsici]|uniref:zeta toxin family protein n=1 Tax=Lysinibacillus capsici TaxID=2115968 RepID=UPI002DBCC97B|nr:zeta toxin family protein [Lysinibacillus capsici]MEC1305431.1 zeta toxin family protein [Lysinibacillus capsici]